MTVAPIWPWGLTALTGQAIGAWVVSIGVIAAHAVYENDWSRLRSFAASYALLALLQLIALLRHGGEIDWTAPAGWFYLLFLLSVGAVGFSGLLPKARQSDALNDS